MSQPEYHIALLKRELDENYDLYNGYEISPKLRDDIEALIGYHE